MPNRSETRPLRRLPGIDHEFSNPALLEQALTHRSHGGVHYERLEFLGDSLLNLCAAELLFERRPDADEGDLSRLRSRLVRDVTLAQIASNLHLSEFLRLGLGEMKSGGFLRASILADVIEALIGAVYLDAGFDAARRVVRSLLAELEEGLPDADQLKDPKTRLQELLQGRGYDLPEYSVVAEQGADHAKLFRVRCSVGELAAPVEGEGSSRRKAEQAAARRMHADLLAKLPVRAAERSEIADD